MERSWDVVVVGAGNAALCAAISAREKGASVLVLEAAPREQRGGNSHFTDGAIRFAYEGLDELVAVMPQVTGDEARRLDVGSYPASAYLADLERMSGGKTDPTLARLLATRSYPTIRWMARNGVAFAPIYDNQAFEEGGTFRFWGGLVVRAVGRGIGLMDHLFRRCAELGVAVRYESAAAGLIRAEGRITGVEVDSPSSGEMVRARTVVLACGGFEADSGLRARHLGPGWDRAVVRGTRYNTGRGLEMAMAAGARPWGDWGGCHAVAMDLGAPAVGDFGKPGDVYKKHSYPLGIIVNREGRRFVDEGADFRNYTYARYGRELLRQPGGVAYQVFDGQVAGLLRSEYAGPDATRFESDTLEGLVEQLDVARGQFLATVAEYNGAVQEDEFRPSELDGKGTDGITPPKSNWALRIERPPFLAFPVTCGITFTFGGVRVDETATVLGEGDIPIPGLYAAGEMVGGLFHDNYPGGAGLMSGAVFGRLAGASAASVT
jgi:tricarballylate dehydrogenase